MAFASSVLLMDVDLDDSNGSSKTDTGSNQPFNPDSNGFTNPETNAPCSSGFTNPETNAPCSNGSSNVEIVPEQGKEVLEFAIKKKPRRGRKILTQEAKEDIFREMDSVLNKAKEFTSHVNELISQYEMSAYCIPVQDRKSNRSSSCPEQPNLFSGGTLLPHQIKGYQWLKSQFLLGLNCILADEMGLGKTIQIIATIAELISIDCQGPFLICVPLSTLQNWCNEFKRFAPKIPVLRYYGFKEERKELREKINIHHKIARRVSTAPVVISTIQTVMKDTQLTKYDWKCLIVDEAHQLKNDKSKFFETLKKFKSRQCSIMLLTGTPIQNNMKELWSLLHFIMPEIFKNFQGIPNIFDTSVDLSSNNVQQFVTDEEKDHIVEKVQQIITPFLLRRTKKEANLNLPPKKEIIIYTPLTNSQSKLYAEIVQANKPGPIQFNENNLAVNDSFLRKRQCPASYSSDSDEDYADHFSKLAVISPIKQQCQSLHGISNQNAHLKSRNLLMTLRKVCLHPITIQQDNIDLWSISDADHLIRECGKLLILDSLLTNLQKRGHKVLIFSQFVSMLDILTKYCELKNWSFCRFDGQTDFDSRCSEIEKFQKNKSVSIFLLSTRAGGLGINLTEADTVIIYDSDWNPQQDIQAQDRCHRYGQTKPVVVYRLVSEGTVDEEIVAEALRKKKLEKLIIHEGRFSTNDTLSKVQNPLTADDVNKVFCDSSTISVRCKKDEPLSSTTLEKLLDRSDML